MRVKTKLSAQFSLEDAADEFLSYKQAQKVRERTLKEYKPNTFYRRVKEWGL